MSKLKVHLRACPFCGGEKLDIDNNEVISKYYDDPEIPVTHWVVCRTCFSSGAPEESKDAAITAWNKRADEEEE